MKNIQTFETFVPKRIEDRNIVMSNISDKFIHHKLIYDVVIPSFLDKPKRDILIDKFRSDFLEIVIEKTNMVMSDEELKILEECDFDIEDNVYIQVTDEGTLCKIKNDNDIVYFYNTFECAYWFKKGTDLKELTKILPML